jgi:hypothetical protein
MSLITSQIPSNLSQIASQLKQAAQAQITALTSTTADAAKAKSPVTTAAQAAAAQVLRAAGGQSELNFHFGDSKSPINTNVVDSSRLGGKQQDGVKAPSQGSTLPGGVELSLDPTKRPDLATLSGAALKSLISGRGADLLKQFGKNPLDADLASSSTKNPGETSAQRQNDLSSFMQSQLDQFNADNSANRPTDKRSLVEDDTSGGTGGTTGGTPAPAPAPAKKSTTDTLKEVGKEVLNYLADVVIEKLGPPGPAKTFLDAPGYVEKVTGRAADLLDGVKAINQSGDKNPEMKKILHDIDNGGLTSPDGDEKLAPQQQKVIDQLVAQLGGIRSTPTVASQGTNLISQPKRGDDSTPPPPHDRDAVNSDIKPVRDNSNVINPGSGDGGTDGGTTTGPAAPPSVPGVADPANPTTGIDTNKPAGNTPSGPKPSNAA